MAAEVLGKCLLAMLIMAVLSSATRLSAGTVDSVYFAPYDSRDELQMDVALAVTVTEACLANKTLRSPGEENPYQILWAVYNLLDMDYIQPLIDAFNAGVEVKVLIEFTQLSQPYVPLYEIFKNNSLRVAPTCYDTNRNLSLTNLQNLNLVGIDVQEKTTFSNGTGIMHTKTRYFRWNDNTGVKNECVASGSMNTEDTALLNDETLLITSDPESIRQYLQFFWSTLYNNDTALNVFIPTQTSNLLYSLYAGNKSTAALSVVLDWLQNEEELIIFSVYCLLDLYGPVFGENPLTGLALVDVLCDRKKAGVKVMVMTDKDCCDGDGSFNSGDDTVTAYQIAQCDIPVYKCKNWGCPDPTQCYTAFHHKNVVFGTPKAKAGTKITTGTANWSGSSMGGGVGKKAYTPVNAETQVFLANETVTWTRFLSNSLYSIRKYESQQACPYLGPNNTVVTDQCAGSPRNPFNQPNWTQPAYSSIFEDFSQLVSWPTVNVTFAVEGLASSDTVYVFMVASNSKLYLSFDANTQAWLGELPDLKIGSILSYAIYVNNTLASPTTQLIVDPAYDWTANVRLPDANIVVGFITEIIQF